MVDAQSEGRSVHELNEKIHCDTAGFREALNTAKKLLSSSASEANSVFSKLAEMLGMERSELERHFGKSCDADLAGEPIDERDLMKLKVKAHVGMGVSAEVCLGWCDTKGYHMVGVGGEA